MAKTDKKAAKAEVVTAPEEVVDNAAEGDAPKDEEPDAKKPKVEEEPKEAVEAEQDEVDDRRGRTKLDSALNPYDSSLDSVVAGNVVTGLSTDMFAVCRKGVRGTVGVKAGRYYFEVRIIEFNGHSAQRAVALGVSSSSASLVPKQGQAWALFQNDSIFYNGAGTKQSFLSRTGVPRRGFHVGDCLGVLLNLTDKGNANTISLFVNGTRLGEPMPMGEMKADAWFPHIVVRGATLSVHLGPEPLQALPFKVRMFSNAASADAIASPVTKPNNSTKPVAVVPVGLPNNGIYDWVDDFLSKNPSFMEVSGRAAVKYVADAGNNLLINGGTEDRPTVAGESAKLSELHNPHCRDWLLSAAVTRRQNVVVAGALDNLRLAERQRLLNSLGGIYSVRAVVIAGEPPAALKKKARETLKNSKLLAHEKLVTAIRNRKEKIRETKLAKKKADRTKAIQSIILRRKAAAKAKEMKKKVEEQRAADAKRRKEAEEKKAAEKKKAEAPAEGEAAAKDAEEKPAEEEKKAEATAEAKAEEKPAEDKPAEEEEAPVDELNDAIDPETLVPEVDENDISDGEPEPEFKDETDYEKVLFMPRELPEFSPELLEIIFDQFALPSTTEGFEKVDFAWEDQKVAEAALAKLRTNCQKVEQVSVKPSDWFKEQVKAFALDAGKWKDSQEEALKKEQEKLREKAKKEAGEVDPVEEDEEEVEIWGVEDIFDVGTGVPLFKKFHHEDWVMLGLRFELHVMVHAFAAAYPDRPGIHPDLLNHYSHQYFNKPLQFEFYGQKSMEDFLVTLSDTISVNDDTGCIEPGHPDDVPFDTLIKLTEEARRERAARIEAGDESAKLVIGDRMPKQFRKGGGKGKGFHHQHHHHHLHAVRPVVAKGFGPKGLHKGGRMIHGHVAGPVPGLRASPYAVPPPPAWGKGLAKGFAGRGRSFW